MFNQKKVKRLEAQIEEQTRQIEQLKLDNEFLVDQVELIRFIVDHPPQYKKGETVRNRYVVEKLFPLTEAQSHKRDRDIAIAGLLFGTGIAAMADLVLGTRLRKVALHYTKKHAFMATSMKKTFWKYLVYDKSLKKEVIKLENELTWYLVEG